MAHVRKFDMKYKKSVLTILTVVFASCGGGGGSVVVKEIARITNSFLMIPAVY